MGVVAPKHPFAILHAIAYFLIVQCNCQDL